MGKPFYSRRYSWTKANAERRLKEARKKYPQYKWKILKAKTKIKRRTGYAFIGQKK